MNKRKAEYALSCTEIVQPTTHVDCTGIPVSSLVSPHPLLLCGPAPYSARCSITAHVRAALPLDAFPDPIVSLVVDYLPRHLFVYPTAESLDLIVHDDWQESVVVRVSSGVVGAEQAFSGFRLANRLSDNSVMVRQFILVPAPFYCVVRARCRRNRIILMFFDVMNMIDCGTTTIKLQSSTTGDLFDWTAMFHVHLLWVPDCQRLLVSRPRSTTVSVYSLRQGNASMSMEEEKVLMDASVHTTLDSPPLWSPTRWNGVHDMCALSHNLVSIVYMDGTIGIWNVLSGKLVQFIGNVGGGQHTVDYLSFDAIQKEFRLVQTKVENHVPMVAIHRWQVAPLEAVDGLPLTKVDASSPVDVAPYFKTPIVERTKRNIKLIHPDWLMFVMSTEPYLNPTLSATRWVGVLVHVGTSEVIPLAQHHGAHTIWVDSGGRVRRTIRAISTSKTLHAFRSSL